MANYAHVEWLDLKNDGILVECAIMKRDPEGNIYHFQIAPLDHIDKKRLRNIVTNRNAGTFPLWDLMQNVTLGNGINALEYFHQLVKVKTPQGAIIDPMPGRRGASAGRTQQQVDAAITSPSADQPGDQSVLTEGDVDTRTPQQKRADTIAANQAAAAKKDE